MTQELRNKVYAVASLVLALLITLGVVDQAHADEALTLTNGILDLVGQGFALAGLIVAFVKSLPSKTTTIDLPKAVVDSVNTTEGVVVAGPANALPDGTVL
jgi:hypothetical protein